VDQVQTRVVAAVRLEIEGFLDPVTGQLVALPDQGQPLLNRLYLRRGRLPGRENEVVVSESFAKAHGFELGDRLVAVINGRRETLTLVGVALSPEYIYQISPGALFPDFERYGVLWMGEAPLKAAYDMEGAFNDVVLTLVPGASTEDVLDRLDELLTPYGGLGAYAREDQVSHRYLSEEFRQLEQLATIFPVIFLGVAAFLLNVVVSRLISTQREQIAALKAFGYSNLAVGVHYLKLVLLIVLLGLAGGLALGTWLGQGMSHLYMEFYRFPFLKYRLRPSVAIAAALVSFLAGTLGTLYAVRRAARLPPAEAMRPEPPTVYRETLVERLGLKRLLSQPTRMIARHLERRPVKSLLSVIGIALACAIMMVGSFQKDAVDFMVQVQFGLAQRDDLAVTFVEPTSKKVLYSLASLPGIEHAEPFRAVPVRLHHRHRRYRTAIQGIPPGAELQRLLDAKLKPIALPPAGIVLTDHLGEILGVRPGDVLTVEVLEGSRPVRQVPVAALVKQYIGVGAYMDLTALNRLLREGESVSGAYLAVDSRDLDEVYAALKEMPRIAGAVVRESAIRNFYETMGETLLIFTTINTLLAGTIAFGVVYNNARIALAERSRELASLRVLGFTRAEVSYILLGELAVLTLAAIPVGFVTGRALAAYIVAHLRSDLYRVPLVLAPNTYAFAATVVLVSALLSGLIVRRRLDHLDLVAVLKTRE
jgi:putative ABC transport system permease protein